MTREEAIKVLRTESVEIGGNAVSVCRFWEALDMAVKALEAVPDKDAGKMTNADRIRSMSDEELATMLKDYKDCSKNCIISNGKHCYQICEEESVLLKWLKQPVEEETV